jgi:hypothetical protein
MHINRGFTHIPTELQEALHTLAQLIEANEPRLIDTRFLEWVHLYVDASFEPASHSGVGGMLLDCRGRCLGFFSEVVSPALTPAISRADQKTVIFELEGLALATGISLFRQEIAGKDS